MITRAAGPDAGTGQERTRPLRVALVDDHEIVRRGLRELLEASGVEVVGEAGTAAEAVRRMPALRPDVVLLDMQLPDGSGVEVCRELRAMLPDTRVLVLTSYDDDEALFASVLAGASGYLLKQVRGADLVNSVERVAAGQSLLGPEVTARVLERLRSPGLQRDSRLAALTDQERRVLDLVAEGLTNRQVGVRLGLAEKTVKNHVSGVLAKLGLGSRTQAALYLRDHG